VNGSTPLPAAPASSGASGATSAPSAGPLSGEMSLRLDLSPDARRLLQSPAAPVSGRFSPAAPFGTQAYW
jgi:hypothetical protein